MLFYLHKKLHELQILSGRARPVRPSGASEGPQESMVTFFGQPSIACRIGAPFSNRDHPPISMQARDDGRAISLCR